MVSWIVVPALVLIIGALAALTWRDAPRLGPMGRTTYVITAILAVPLATIADALVFETLINTASPAGGAFAFFAATLPAVLFAAGTFLVMHIRWEGRAWWWLALPTGLLFVSGALTAAPLGATLALPLGALGLFATAALVPPAASRLLDQDTPVRQALGALLAGGLLFLAAPNVFAVPVFVTEGAQHAEHTWETTYVPDAGTEDASYMLRIPYLVAEGQETQEILDRLTRDLVVVEGAVSFTLEGDGTALEVTGSGPFTIAATTDFYGTAEHREAFAYALATPPLVDLQAETGRVAGALTTRIDLSGGDGHTCWQTGHDSTHIQAEADETKVWPAPDPFGDEGPACA